MTEESNGDNATSCCYGHFASPDAPKNSFHWGKYLRKKKSGHHSPHLMVFSETVPLFSNVGMDVIGSHLELDLLCKKEFWIYRIVDTEGYFFKVKPLGGKDEWCEFWVHFACPHYHEITFAQNNKFTFKPPFVLTRNEIFDALRSMQGSKTLDRSFQASVIQASRLQDHSLHVCPFKEGQWVEVMDKTCVSKMRRAKVSQIVACGYLMEVEYEACADTDEESSTYWISPKSSLVHPIGWSNRVGHDFEAGTEQISEVDIAPLASFAVPLQTVDSCSQSRSRWVNNQKLEVVDPLNMCNITVGTVAKVLDYNYLMIAVDGPKFDLGPTSEHFCLHESSPYILPVGFCKRHQVSLTPPPGFKGEFDWDSYLQASHCPAAPESNFKDFSSEVDFDAMLEVGHKVESVDLMTPWVICVGTVAQKAHHLVKISYDSWPSGHDQWKFALAEDIYPMGFCELVGYELSVPRQFGEIKKRNKRRRPRKF